MKASAELWAGAEHMHIVWGENIKTGVVESLNLINFYPNTFYLRMQVHTSIVAAVTGHYSRRPHGAWAVRIVVRHHITSVYVNLPHTLIILLMSGGHFCLT